MWNPIYVKDQRRDAKEMYWDSVNQLPPGEYSGNYILMPSGLWGTSLGLGDYSCRMGVGGIQGSRFVIE